MAKRHKNKGLKAHSHGGGLSKSRGNSKAGRGRGRGNAAADRSRSYPELMDLEAPHSMKQASRRPGRRMMDEVEFTSRERDDTMRKPLRKNPIVFVKAVEVYDPSADLFKRVKEEKERRRNGDNLDKLDKLVGQAVEEVGEDAGEENVLEKDQNGDKLELEQPVSVLVPAPLATDIATGSDTDGAIEIPVNIITENDTNEHTNEGVNVESEVEQSQVEKNSTNADFDLSSDKTDRKIAGSDLPIELQGNKSVPSDLPKHSQHTKQVLASVQDDKPLYFIDETGDSSVETPQTQIKATDLPSNNPKKVSPEPLDTTATSPLPALEFDPMFSIGKVHLNSRMAEDGSLEAQLPRLDRYRAAQDYISQIMQSNNMYVEEDDDEMDTSEEEFIMNAEEDDEEEGEDDYEVNSIQKLSLEDPAAAQYSDYGPEYGFAEEDYLFDISSIEISNVRFGADNNKQFYLRSYLILGQDDFVWMDAHDLGDFLIDNGMAGHRVELYYQYVMTNLGVLPAKEQGPEDQPNYSDVYISESEEEIDEHDDYNDSELDSDEDGIGTLMEYASKGKLFSHTREDDIPSTETIKTKGKGNRRTLDLQHLDDLLLMESLQDQYITHKKSRKLKKLDAKAGSKELEEAKHNLSAKYPYSMHIKDIKDEFELFLHDGNRTALTFPPLDPHGLKTLKKLADFYNMKSRKFGKGLKTHIVCIKSKRTYRSVPYYNDIGHVLKQRPVFNRTDVKRDKDEIANSKDGSKSRSGGGAKSKAHVKEGDIVGFSAPEIGQENIGRRMLEKLGWSKGEGLGVDSRGISEPIFAKVKNTKLGIK